MKEDSGNKVSFFLNGWKGQVNLAMRVLCQTFIPFKSWVTNSPSALLIFKCTHILIVSFNFFNVIPEIRFFHAGIDLISSRSLSNNRKGFSEVTNKK